MRRESNILIVAVLSVMSISCGDNYQNKDNTYDFDTSIEDNDDNDGKDQDMEKYNRRLIAEAIGVDEEQDILDYIQAGLKRIEIGKLQNVKYTKDKEEYIDIVAEDNTNYRIFISGGGILAIHNLDNGDWPFMAYQ